MEMSAPNKKSSNKDGGFTCGLLSDTHSTLRKHPRPSLTKDRQSSSARTQSQINVPSIVSVGEPYTRTPRPVSLTLPFQNRQRESHLVTDDDLTSIMRRYGSLLPSLPSHRSGLRTGIDLGRSSSGGAFGYRSEGSRMRGAERQRPASMSLGGVSQRFDIDTGKLLPVCSMPSRDPTLTALPNPPTKCDLAVYPNSDSDDEANTYRNSREKVNIYAAMADDAYYESVTTQSSKTVMAPPPTRVASPIEDDTNKPSHKRKFSRTMANMVESMKKRIKRPESANMSNTTTVAATPVSSAGPAYSTNFEPLGENAEPKHTTLSQATASENAFPSPADSDDDSDKRYSGPIRPGETYQDAINRIVYGPRMMDRWNNGAGPSSTNTHIPSNSTTKVHTPTNNRKDDEDTDMAMDIDTPIVDATSELNVHDKDKSRSTRNPLKSTWSAVKNLKHKQYNPFAPLFAPKEPPFDMINPPSHQPVTPTISAPIPVTPNANAPSPSPCLTNTQETPTAITHAANPLLTPLPAPWQTLPRPVLASEIARLENRTRDLLEKEARSIREIEYLRGRVGVLERRRDVSGSGGPVVVDTSGSDSGPGGDVGSSSADGGGGGMTANVMAERRRGIVGFGGLIAGRVGGGVGGGVATGEEVEEQGHGDGDVDMTEEERRMTWMTVEE